MSSSHSVLATIGHLLTSPVWPLLVGLLAIVVSVVLFLRGRSRRQLTYSVTTRSLLSVGSEVAGEVEILYRAEPVQQVELVSVTIANRGNTPILAADFEREIAIALPGSGRLLTASVEDVQPPGLEPRLSAEGDRGDPRICIAPLLLNPGDSFTASAMVADYGDAVQVSGRVVGVHDIAEDRSTEAPSWSDAAFIGLLAAFFLWIYVPGVIHRWNVTHDVIDTVLAHNVTRYQPAQLSTGRRVCVHVVGFDGTRKVLKVKGSKSSELLSVLPRQVRITDGYC